MSSQGHDHSGHGQGDRNAEHHQPVRHTAPAQRDGHHDHSHHSPATFRDRFWLSLVLTAPVLYFSKQIQAWLGYQAVSFPGSEWVNPVLGTILFFYAGLVFLRGAVQELRSRRPGMMTLVSLAITVAYGYSMAVAFGAPGMSFFWELATLLAIMLLGHWLELKSVAGASRALDELTKLLPSVAHRLLADGRIEDVSVVALRLGDLILVRPGEQVPADGVVTGGASTVNEAFLTGESRPVPKEAGSEVVAASVNREGALTVQVTRTGDDTTLSQVQRLVREGQQSRSRFQALADRAAGWLFYIAIVAAALTFVAWWLAEPDPQAAITRTVAVLVIACPHALGLAIPLVIVNATALSAGTGILVRNREAFERAKDIRTVAFDKTGTLTEGIFGVRGVYVAGVTEAEALRIAAALELRSEHPLGQTIVEHAAAVGVPRADSTAFEIEAGKGVRGEVDGVAYAVGRPEWAGELGLPYPPALANALAEAEGRGESVIALLRADRPLALFSLSDRVRESAKTAVSGLRAMGVSPVMITGDSEAVAKTVAEELGIERYHARVLPKDKASMARELRRDGPVAFVGDGINDAPALLEADLGIAIGAGTNVAIESADLVLVDDDPRDVLAALKLSRATYSKMVQNLLWATGYNVLAIPLAAGALAWAGVLLSPAVGALLMSLSTIVVAVNAMTLRRVA